LQVDRPRFGSAAPQTVVALAYVPIDVAAKAKQLSAPSKAGAAAEKAANEASKSAPIGDLHTQEAASPVATKFVTSASPSTLRLMELGFEYVAVCEDIVLE